MATIDELDVEILARLTENARVGVAELAAELGVSRTTVNLRLKRLEEDGGLLGFRPVIDLAQADLGDSRKERRGGDGQWHHGRPHAIGGADYQPGERDQRHHQNQKWNRAEQIDERAQHAVQRRCLVDSALVAGDQEYRQRNPHQQGDQR